MDTQRSALLIVFLFSLFMLWDGWQRQSQPPVAPAAVTTTQSPGAQAPVPTASTPAGAADVPAAVAEAPKAATRVVTDLFIADVSAEGGSLIRMELLKHRAGPDSDGNFLLLDNGGLNLYHAQSG
jgi:YidC/Oxa1 family membrane protein insertase